MGKIYDVEYSNGTRLIINLEKVQRICLKKNKYDNWELCFYYGYPITYGNWYEEGCGSMDTNEACDYITYSSKEDAETAYNIILKKMEK